MGKRYVAHVQGALCLLAGALLPLAFAPFNLWPLAVLLPTVLLWRWDQCTSAWQASIAGLLFGLGAYGTGIYWIFISLHDYGNAPAIFAALATFAVVLLMAGYWALLGAILHRLSWPKHLRNVVAVPILWVVADLLRGTLLTGFPWLALGYSQIDSPLRGWAPIIGVYGLSGAVLLSAALLKTMVQQPHLRGRVRWSAPLLALWISAWALTHVTWVQPMGAPIRVSLVQGNVDQAEKWQPTALDASLNRYVQLSLPEHGNTDVIIWPETAIPAFFAEVRPFVERLAQEAQRDRVDYLTGIVTGTWVPQHLQNSVVKIGADVQFYHKRRLLVFGEYLPLRGLFTFFRHWVDIPMADFTPGAPDQPLLHVAGEPIGTSICFEAVFASGMRQGLPEATWLVNISNDAWFKRATAADQHLQIVRMRALELGRNIARATNTGLSAIIDAQGVVRVQGGQFTAEVVRGTVQPLQGQTPYARWLGMLPEM